MNTKPSQPLSAVQRASNIRVASVTAQAMFAGRKKDSLTGAFADLAPVFAHFGITVKRRKGGWVLKRRGDQPVAISGAGDVEIESKSV